MALYRVDVNTSSFINADDSELAYEAVVDAISHAFAVDNIRFVSIDVVNSEKVEEENV